MTIAHQSGSTLSTSLPLNGEVRATSGSSRNARSKVDLQARRQVIREFLIRRDDLRLRLGLRPMVDYDVDYHIEEDFMAGLRLLPLPERFNIQVELSALIHGHIPTLPDAEPDQAG